MSNENVVALLGIAKSEVKEGKKINGTTVDCWRFELETERNSGTKDTAIIYYTQDAKEDILPFMQGLPVMVIGKLQTCKDFSTNRVLTFVLADYVGVVNGKNYDQQNEVKIVGRLGKGITYRTRNSGKRITTIMLEVDSALRAATKCYIPCICWQAVADKVKDWKVGEPVELYGRLQSRDFIKYHENGDEEQRTSYEVSVSSITKLKAEHLQ